MKLTLACEVEDSIKASADTKLVELKAEMNMGFANVDTKFAELSGDVKAINQKLASLDDRVKNQDGKLWTLVTIILGLLPPC